MTCRPRLAPRLVVTFAVAACALLSQLAVASPAGAHASLVGTTPENGTLLDEPVDTVTIEFDEVVDPREVALIDEDGDRETISVGRGQTLEVPVDTTDGGWYAVSWRVVSPDGHPIGGAITFRVGTGAAEAPAALQEAASAAGEDGDDPIRSAGRFLAMLGVLVLVGSAFLGRHALSEPYPQVRQVGLAASVVAAVGGAVSLSGAVADDLVAWPGTVADAAPIAAAVAVLLWGRDAGPNRLTAVVGLGVAILATAALTGHVAADATVAARVGLVAHLVAGAVWLGATPALAVAVRAGAGWDAVRRFSTAATVALAVLLVAGAITTWLLADGLDAMTGTTWGRLLLVKLALVALAVAAGATNRRLAATGTRRDWLQRLLVAEALLLVGVLVATVAMTRHAPDGTSAADSTGVVATFPVGPLDAELFISPPEDGARQVHLTLFEDRRPVPVEQITLSFSTDEHGIQPIPQRLTRVGVGHVLGTTTDLRLRGTWTAHVGVRVDRFTEHSGTAELRIGGG